MTIYTYETYYDQKLTFKLSDKRFIYQMDDETPISADWGDIQSLKLNRMANTLDIVVTNREKPITVPYGIENFLVFLDELSSRLAKANQKKIESMNDAFGVTGLFLFMMSLFIGPAVILICAVAFNYQSIAQMTPSSILVTIIVPLAMIIYGVCIPVKARPENDRLRINGLIRRSVYPYTQFESVDYELLDMKKRGSLLVVVIKLKNGLKIKIKWLKDLTLFFIVLRHKLNRFHKD